MKTYNEFVNSLQRYRKTLDPQHIDLLNARSLKNIAKQSESTLSNKNFMSLMILNNPLALQYASEEIKDDEEIVTFAVGKNAQAFIFASSRLKNDHSFVLGLLPNRHCIFNQLDPSLKNDKTFVLKAIDVNPTVIKWVRDDLKSDLDILKLALEKNPSCVRYFSKKKRQEIGKHDPLEYISKLSLKQRLNADLDNDHGVVRRNKI